jgi:hypothetical protein
MSLMALVLIPLIAVGVILIPILLGVFVYRDAKAHDLDPLLWTLVAIFAPGFIGLIVYLAVRLKTPPSETQDDSGSRGVLIALLVTAIVIFAAFVLLILAAVFGAWGYAGTNVIYQILD